MRFNTRTDLSHHGPRHPFKDAGIVSDSLTGIHGAMVRCLFVVNRSYMYKGFRCPHSQKSRGFKSSVEAMQWVLLYLIHLSQ
jgi:hypothetical protein